MRAHRIALASLTLLPLLAGPAGAADEEFAGPFPSWADVRRDYGARGDGKADDTAAIQKALDDLRQHRKFCVLYFPAGTYRVTATVKTTRKAHTDCMCAVVGEDPDTTALRWDGPAGGTLFHYDAWYAAIRRLTLEVVEHARKADLRIIGWVVNTQDHLRLARAFELDGATTDYPEIKRTGRFTA